MRDARPLRAVLTRPGWPALEPAMRRFWDGFAAALAQTGLAVEQQPEWRDPAGETAHPGPQAEPATEPPAPLADPELLLGQIGPRGWTRQMDGRLQLVATPDHALPGCPPGHTRTGLVVRVRETRFDPADFAAAPVAATPAQMAALGAHAAASDPGFGLPGLARPVIAASDGAAARMVATGEADLAAIDALSWQMVKRYEPFSLELRILGWTAPVPCGAFVCGRATDPAAIRRALDAALDGLSEADRRLLHLNGLVEIPAERHLAAAIHTPLRKD